MKERVTVEHVGKQFTLFEHRSEELKTTLSNLVKFKFERAEKFWALQDVSFKADEGEVVGIIGRNGSGKSTLLKLLSKITVPTKGRITLYGRTNTLLEVGTGFHPELTGRENVYLNGSILGMSRKEISKKFDSIVDFSEVGSFLDTPMKHFSSGMYVRLAFAVAAHLDPDILIVDEVLAVGDQSFQHKCLQRMEQDVLQGRTVLFVSHDMQAIQKLCHRVVLLDQGRVVMEGSTADVVGYYLDSFPVQVSSSFPPEETRKGTGLIRTRSIQLLDVVGAPLDRLTVGAPLSVKVAYHSDHETLSSVNLEIVFKSINGQVLFKCFSNMEPSLRTGLQGSGTLRCHIPRLNLNVGEYIIGLNILVDRKLADRVPEAALLTVAPGQFYHDLLPYRGNLVLVDYVWEVAE